MHRFVIIFCYFVGIHGVNDFRANVEGPIVMNFQFFQYFCNLLDSRSPPSSSAFQVVFLFDFLEDPKVPRVDVASSNDRAAVDQTYLMDKMDQQIRCRAESIPSGSEVLFSSNYINIGLERMFTRSPRDSNHSYACDSCVFESDKDPLTVTFKATVPFRCPDSGLYTRCLIAAGVTTTKNLVVKDTGSQNPCLVFFTFSDFFNLYASNLSIYAVKDEFTSSNPRPNSVTLNFPSFPTFTLNGTTFQDNWNNYVAETDIRHVDDPRAFCTVSGVSQVTTFDGFSYLMKGIGQFVYVTTGGLTPFELRHWPCSLDSGRSCVCGVAVQEQTTDVIVDMCTDGVPRFISHSCLDFPTKTGIKVIANTERNRFAILFSSGNRIYASVVGRELSLDVYVNSDKRSLLSGLCGSYDNSMANDLQMVSDFERWRLPIGSSIFDGRLAPLPSASVPPLTTSGDSFCSCSSGVASCGFGTNNFGLTEQLDYGMKENVQPFVPADFGGTCPRLDYYYYSRRYLYYGWMNASSYDLRWPTVSGISEAAATAHCRSVLWDSSPISGVCAAMTNQDLNHVLERCKIEIQIWDYLGAARNIEPELGRLCLAKGAATQTQDGLAGLGVLKNISSALCESFTCNFEGSCQNGSCHCVSGIPNTSLDCSYFQKDIMSVISKFKGRLCDVRTEGCTQLLLYTKNIKSIFPRCHFALKKVFFGPVYNLMNNTYLGSRVDENRTMCYPHQDYLDVVSYPEDHRISRTARGSPLLFDLSVGNDGLSFSAPLPILIYDSYCYNCTDVPDFACVTKNLDGRTCLINGYCIKNGTLKTDDTGFYCNVDLNPTSWIPINTMPTTTVPTPENLLANYLTKLSAIPDLEIPPGDMVKLANGLTGKYLDPNPLCVNMLDNAKSMPAITPILGADLVTNLEYFLYTYCQKNEAFQEVAANMAAEITGITITIGSTTQGSLFSTLGKSSTSGRTNDLSISFSGSISRNAMIAAIVIGILATITLLALLSTLWCCYWGTKVPLTSSWGVMSSSTPRGVNVPTPMCGRILPSEARCTPECNTTCSDNRVRPTSNEKVYPGVLSAKRILLRFRNGFP